MTQDDLSSADERPSKSQLKREMHALQALGEQLIAMKDSERSHFPLSDDLLRAIEETGRIKAREARRRHMQYVGKLMRHEDLDGIQAVFDAMEREQLRRDNAFHQLEAWRDRLIEEGDAAIEPLLDDYPSIDRQALRQLIRNARHERDQQKPPTNARRLFKLLREAAQE